VVSCSGIQMSRQGVVTAVCGNEQGSSNNANIDLNSFISNINRNLVNGAGSVASCNKIRWFELGTNNQGMATECALRTTGPSGTPPRST
jgi:hypothetical protein